MWSKNYFGEKKFGAKICVLQKLSHPKKLSPKSLVKIGAVTAEILLIWTNVVRTYMLPGQMAP